MRLIFGPFWDHSGVILGFIWGGFGVSLESVWNLFEVCLDQVKSIFWVHLDYFKFSRRLEDWKGFQSCYVFFSSFDHFQFDEILEIIYFLFKEFTKSMRNCKKIAPQNMPIIKLFLEIIRLLIISFIKFFYYINNLFLSFYFFAGFLPMQ